MRKPHQLLTSAPAWIFTILILGAILWLTLAPKPLGDEDIPLFPGADKIAHALMFGALTGAVLLDWQRKRGWRKVPVGGVWLTAAGASAVGVAVEFAQRSMHLGRGFEITDMIADGAGAALCALAWLFFEPRWLIHEKEKNSTHLNSRK